MSEILTEIGGFQLTVSFTAGAASFLTAILFTVWWIIDRRKRTAKLLHAGMLINGIGFAFLPSLSILKAFEVFTDIGGGRVVMEPLPLIRWLSEAGRFEPCRIELAAVIACFTGICLWMIIRKQALPDNGDLLLISLGFWALIRLVTETLRTEPRDIYRYCSCGAMLFCLLVWTLRRGKQRFAGIRIAADLLTAAICTGMIVLTMNGILSAGSEIADLAVISGCGLLILILSLLAGGDMRKLNPEKADPDPVNGDTVRMPGPVS